MKTKTIENQGEQQFKALKALQPEGNQELESVEGHFTQKKGEIMKLKMQ